MRPSDWRDKLLFWAALLCIGLAILLGGCASSPVYERPPAQYQGDRRSVVEFTDNAAARCVELNAAPNSIACGVVGGALMVLPNPCRWPDPFAELVCHELGHNNRWAKDHPKH